MTDSNRPAAAFANPFPGDLTSKRRDMRDTKWVPVNDISKYNRPSPSRIPELVHKRSNADSEIASFSEGKNDEDASVYSLTKPSIPFIYQRPVSNTDLYAWPSRAASPICERDDVYSADSADFELTDRQRQSFYMEPHNWPAPARTDSSLPSTPFVLPETAKVSPLSGSLPVRRDSPVSAIRLLSEHEHEEQPVTVGWGYVKDSREILKDSGIKKKASNVTIFHKPNYTTISTVPPRPTKKSTNDKKGHAPIPTPPNGVSNGLYANATASKSTPALTVADLYHSAVDIYASGPKGEGQKLWSGIQNFRKQKQAAKRVQAQEAQLNTIYEKAFATEGEVRTSYQPTSLSPLEMSHSISVEHALSRSPSPLASPKPPVMGITRTSNPASSQRGSSSMIASKSLKASGSTAKTAVSDSISPSVMTIHIGASPHVAYDAHEVMIDCHKPYSRVPQINAAPKSRMEVKSFGIGKRGLPPPPVPPRPSPKKVSAIGLGGATMASRSLSVMNEVEREQKNTRMRKGLPPPPVPPGPSPRVAVGLGISFAPSTFKRDAEPRSRSAPARPMKSPHFSALTGKVTQRPYKQLKEGKRNESGLIRLLSKLCNIDDDDQVPNQPYARSVANAFPTSIQNSSKLSISRPQPMQVPNGGLTANISVASGGVGGPAAAVSLSRQELERNEERRRRANGKQRAPTSEPHSRVSADLKARPKAHRRGGESSQSHSFWQDAGKTWVGRKRNKSDASFGCQGIESHPVHTSHPTPYAEYLSLNPHRESYVARAGYRDRSAHSEEDAKLVPQPLFSGGKRGRTLERKGSQVRNTTFYQFHDDVLCEYGS